MATLQTSPNLDTLHALIGRLLSHVDELAGHPNLPPEIATDVNQATEILDEVSAFLAVLAEKLPPKPDLPEASRSSHHSG